jgi:hypothetical protein
MLGELESVLNLPQNTFHCGVRDGSSNKRLESLPIEKDKPLEQIQLQFSALFPETSQEVLIG